jgi:predicted CXXCH cytochrome family protein
MRIGLEYTAVFDPIARGKWIVAVAGLLILAAIAAWTSLGRSGTGLARLHAPAAVAQPHAALDDSCSTCHTEFQPLRDDALPLTAVFGGESGHRVGHSPRELKDRKCVECHKIADHQSNQLDAEIEACAGCHREHRGRDANLLTVLDSYCTRCHKRIAEHGGGSRSLFRPAIADVDNFRQPAHGQAGHPEFRSLKHDPGHIKFNHWLHLQPGLAASDRELSGKPLLTLRALPTGVVERYRRPEQLPTLGSDNDYLVQLDCGSCHQPDNEPFSVRSADEVTGANVDPPLAGNGEHMRPVSYERHCRACHPLSFGTDDDAVLPHRLSPVAIRAYLRGYFAGQGDEQTMDDSPLLPRRWIPGRSEHDFGSTEIPSLLEQVRSAEQLLVESRTCQKCHLELPNSAADRATFDRYRPAREQLPEQGPTLLPALLPAKIPPRWLTLGRFNHAAHRHDCKECHAAAYEQLPLVGKDSSGAGVDAAHADDVRPVPRDQEFVMIAGIDSCRRCHSDRGSNRESGSASFACVECHRYHTGSPPARKDR